MVFAHQQGQFGGPETDEPAGFFLTVPVDMLVNIDSNAVDPPGNLALWVEGAAVSQVVEQGDKTVGLFIGILGAFLLVSDPFVAVLFYEQCFPHLIHEIRAIAAFPNRLNCLHGAGVCFHPFQYLPRV